MSNILIVVDMQNDFITAALGTEEAVAILPRVVERINTAVDNGETVIFTRDTHTVDYLQTQEGMRLPVPHCILETAGWEIADVLQPYAQHCMIIDKPTFGSLALAQTLKELNCEEKIGSVTLIGLCTDICVISNAMLIKAALPEVRVAVEAACCAGVTPESHDNALKAMAMCQIDII